MTEQLEVITAFIDGERVDPQALKEALSHAEGRDYLTDVAALREAMSDGAIGAPSPEMRRRPYLYWFATAAAVLLSAAGGYAIGNRRATDAAAMSAASTQSPPLTAPAPSRIIRFEQGVNWTETAATKSTGGGH